MFVLLLGFAWVLFVVFDCAFLSLLFGLYFGLLFVYLFVLFCLWFWVCFVFGFI